MPPSPWYWQNVVEGEKALNFSPGTRNCCLNLHVDNILRNHRTIFMPKIRPFDEALGLSDFATLGKGEIANCLEEEPVRLLSSTYLPEETAFEILFMQRPKSNDFAAFEIQIISPGRHFIVILAWGMRMGTAVEMEFACN
jgi:hypothetical protein